MDASTSQLIKTLTTLGRKVLAAVDRWAREQEHSGNKTELTPQGQTLWLMERLLSLIKGCVTACDAWLRVKRGTNSTEPITGHNPQQTGKPWAKRKPQTQEKRNPDTLGEPGHGPE